ncbi:hypothetical protein T11_12871 [Trichinella zimbabwensis]|uniref:Uncharacterized protein n=1 Tax=Trichinella zimbabwensis TaxID=268475 RepID=A0A0V1HB97_9BILA|nr:hypothetical protein T11_12871 [Trichinella zimbabwensis]
MRRLLIVDVHALRPPETIPRPPADRRDVGIRAKKEDHASTSVVARFHMPRGRSLYGGENNEEEEEEGSYRKPTGT